VETFDRRLHHLLQTASQTFAERGFNATSMRDLSAACGMSLAGIYHYVRSKQELLGLIQDRCFVEVLAGAHAAVDAATTPEARLRAFIRHHVVYFTGHMGEMKVLAHEEAQLEGAMRAQVRRRKKEYVALLSSLLAAVDRPAVDLKVAAYALFGMINWIYTWYQPGGAIPPERLADQLAELFLSGYTSPGSAAGTPSGKRTGE